VFDVWQNVLAEIEQAVSREAYITWFTGVELLSLEDGVATVGVPNSLKAQMIQKRYGSQIEEALKNNDVEFTELKFAVKPSAKVKPRSMEILRGQEVKARSTRKPSMEKPVISNGLSDEYSMDNFVVATSNEWAVGVARSVIEDPGGRVNPFFLYGGPGLGKTHLVQAIGNELVRKNPKLKILYTTTSDFYSDFIQLMMDQKANTAARNAARNAAFAKKYRELDVLIIDDFQMIMGKDASQVAFFDIFNDLHQHKKQIIVTCDRLPEQLKTLDPRLTSRLMMGGPVDLQMPSFEDRCAILRVKAELRGAEVENEVIEYIAENVRTNIRELEGNLNQVLLYAEMKGVAPSEIINGGMFASKKNSRRTTLNARQIIEKVAKASDLTVIEMCGKSRVAHIKTARQIAMYLLSEELGLSTPKIALEVGVKDHTTVMHGVKKIRNDLKFDFQLREKVEEIREKIYA